jgi:hypothetical protein
MVAFTPFIYVLSINDSKYTKFHNNIKIIFNLFYINNPKNGIARNNEPSESLKPSEGLKN